MRAGSDTRLAINDYFLSYFTKKTEKEKADCHYLLYKYKRSVS
ncbi:hypothetical protein BATR1942_12285 [Bacillus atrophaeus 1942]|uniref:Uncharacterized protein n=1 Tax=Bacillus atrophaeus (strain 1942) TaxID=720555 RepID=A0ABM5LZR5_BACA1|nr:hypothetical protein BATR1942_12285 [Bacillus atrophaeus 1942]EIM12770.1 hypothetical protein UY9_01024 [Bacillus atrophaeus C89]